jgi:hypothetical protein
MKQVVTGAVLGLGGWLATATAISLPLQARGGGGWIDTLGVSLMSGLLAWASVGLLYSALQRWREQSVIAGGVAGVRPVNGNRAVLVGTLEPAGIGPPLRAPFDGSECLTYSYEVSEDRGTGRRRTVFTHLKGVALAPSMIVTRTGSYRLLAVPEFEGDEPRGSREEIIAHLERYIRTTTFTPRDQSAQELIERWNDADGAYRSDVSYTDLTQVNLQQCQLSQQAIRPGSPVCVFGYFSEAKNAIVVSPAFTSAARVIRGRGEQVAASLRLTARNHLIIGVLVAAAALGLTLAFLG